MKEPEIVFCKNGHIYDRAQDSECPYCKQINAKIRELTKEVDVGRKPGRRSDEDDEATVYDELVDDEATVYDELVDDEATVYDERTDDEATVYDERADDEATVYDEQADDEATVYDEAADGKTERFDGRFAKFDRLHELTGRRTTRRQEKDAAPNTKTVSYEPSAILREEQKHGLPQGWLVCVKGEQDYGKIFTLYEGDNFIGTDPDGRITLRQDRGEVSCVLAKVYRDASSRKFEIEKIRNGGATEGSAVLRPYSDVEAANVRLKFYPLVGIYGFEWGQT